MLAFVLMLFGRRRALDPSVATHAETLTSLTDEDLMERYRDDGRVECFEALITRHERRLYHFLLRHTQDAELANDLLQDTLLRVVRSAPTWTRKARFTTWVYTIARNLTVDAARKGKHRRTTSLDAPVGDDPEGRPLVEQTPGTSEDGYDRVDRAEVAVRIEAAIAELSAEQREVFLLRETQQLSFGEIAEIVGVSENTIKSRMRYALENLRLRLADYAADIPAGTNPVAARHRA